MTRTTVNLPDELVCAAKQLSAECRITLSEAVAELMRRGTRPPVIIEKSPGSIARVIVPPGTRQITLEDTLAAEDDW